MSNLLIINKVARATRRLNSPRDGPDCPRIKYTGKRYECYYKGEWLYGKTEREVIEKINACNAR
jgi:hypothetical protein